MFEEVLFAISGIEHGWLYAKIESQQTCVEFANSHIGGCEFPNALVRSMVDMLDGRDVSFLFWQGESCGYVWRMCGCENVMNLQVWFVEKTVMHPVSENEAERLAGSGKLVFKADADMYAFARSVYDAFAVYARGDGMIAWQNSAFADAFPSEALHLLRKKL